MDLTSNITSDICEHRPVWAGRIAVVACAGCGTIDWLSPDGGVDHAEALAALFGTYDLVGPLMAVAAPAPHVLAYAPSSHRKKKHLDAMPRRVWLQASPHLWLSHDGEILLLATNQRILFENMTRGA